MSETPNPPQGPQDPTPGSPPPTPPESQSNATPAGAPAPGGEPASTVPYAANATATAPDAADVEKNKVFAALSYVGILWLVPLLAAKDSPFAKYHCNHGIVVSAIGVVGVFVLIIVSIMSHFIPFPFIGCCTGCVLPLIVCGGVLALSILGIVNAITGKMKPPLPFFPEIKLVK